MDMRYCTSDCDINVLNPDPLFRAITLLESVISAIEIFQQNYTKFDVHNDRVTNVDNVVSLCDNYCSENLCIKTSVADVGGRYGGDGGADQKKKRWWWL